ncbi:NAD(P)/FAD-dependent oxidoreductase [Rapidithrix thailandica]|uniref:NAD(P)/FAD-dependent oxidoreductase n=1 Tax=Rapidithrix thailandica TaxID=413964 RepID=A0AAW9S9U3_9BACT
MKILVIGGGAAGFFAAINCAEAYPQHQVDLFEKSGKVLSKVRISGGGRCNVTHHCFQISTMAKNYPRGEKFLKKAFHRFFTKDTLDWFEKRRVKLKAEEDGRMFPVTDTSQTIVDCLGGAARKAGVQVVLGMAVSKLIPLDNGKFQVEVAKKEERLIYDKVIVATGGSPKLEGLQWLKTLGHQIESPVPSLFTFNIPDKKLTQLLGIAVPEATVSISTTRLSETGPLLITHWGLSGPAVLKLSAWGARELYEQQYQFAARVSWLSGVHEESLRAECQTIKEEYRARKVSNHNPFHLPKRLWAYLLEKSAIPQEKKWGELSKKELNRLINHLINDTYPVKGKTTFKEEFVTCGGVSLKDIDVKTMESKACPGLYFAGEVLNIDGITGGFNFQAAWTTGYIAGLNAGK